MFVKFRKKMIDAPVAFNIQNISTITPANTEDHEDGVIIRTTAGETIEVQEPFDEVIYRLLKNPVGVL